MTTDEVYDPQVSAEFFVRGYLMGIISTIPGLRNEELLQRYMAEVPEDVRKILAERFARANVNIEKILGAAERV